MAYKIKKLTPKHLKAIEIEVTEPRLTYQEIADRIGVTKLSIINWKSSPIYKEELARQLKEAWSDSVKIAQETMIDLARNGNRQAAEYILNSAGYEAPQHIELNNKVIQVSVEDE